MWWRVRSFWEYWRGVGGWGHNGAPGPEQRLSMSDATPVPDNALARARRQLEALEAATRALGNSSDVGPALARIAAAAVELAGADVALVTAADPASAVPRVLARAESEAAGRVSADPPPAPSSAVSGEVTVERAGRGTRVRVTLPAVGGPPGAGAEQRKEMATVLVVDDEGALRDLLWNTCRCGTMAQSAASGAEALELAQRIKPDLIILDVGMLPMSGVDVLRQLKKDPRRGDPGALHSVTDDPGAMLALGRPTSS